MFALPKRYIVEALVVLVCVSMLLAVISRHASLLKESTVTQIEEQILALRNDLQQTYAVSLNNGGDDSLQRVIYPCTSRVEYEHALDTLSQLRGESLTHAKLLLAECGNDAARTRAAMALRMLDKAQFAESLVTLRAKYRDDTAYTEWVQQWNEMAAGESQRAALMYELVALQDEVVDALKSSGDSSRILARAQEVNAKLTIAAQEASKQSVREEELWQTILMTK